MRKIKQAINHLSIRERLVLYGYLTITPVLILICLVLVFHNYGKTLNEKRKNDLSNVNTLADSVSMLQTEIKNFSTYLCIDSEINLLLQSEDEEKKQNARFWMKEAPMRIVQDMLAIKKYSISLAIYPENEIAPYLNGMDASVFLPSIQEVRKTDVYQETLRSDNGMVWKYIPKQSKEVFISNWTDKVVLCREIYGRQKKPLGYIVMGVREEYFRELCESMMKEEDETILVMDPGGGILCQVGELSEETKAYLQSDEFLKQDYRERVQQFTYEGYDITCTQPAKKASIVCILEPKSELSLLGIVYMPLVLLAGMLVGLLPLLLIISTTITKPLKQVREAISAFAQGDFEQQIVVTTYDEVGEVADCFNRMVGDIKKLIDENYVITLKEKESELTALQAQINPHFLYNTLDCLYWQAMEEGSDEVAESILTLSELFRRVLSQGQREITVGQEMELISCYLQIQKIRFSKRLNYQIEMDDSIKNAMIPKLILQPFVENAIVHGFENVSTPCLLSVTATKKEGWIQFEVKDTGLGMSPEQIDKIFKEEPVQYAKQRIGRYAIRNICQRLQLKYHENFKLDIQSDLGKGTVVTLLIPLEVYEECQSSC